MKKLKALLIFALIAALISIQASASFKSSGISTVQTYKYYYQLERDDDNTTAQETVYKLYVQSMSDGAPPLHGGNIALETDYPVDENDISFTSAGWRLIHFAYSSGASAGINDIERGKTSSGNPYISFGWYEDKDGGDGVSSNLTSGKQFIGTLKIPAGFVEVDKVHLLSWDETKTGADIISDWKSPSQSDSDAMIEIIESVWRIPDKKNPSDGYYQGYYAEEVTDGDGNVTSEHAVDLTAGWEGMTISAYAPQKAARILFYQNDEESGSEILAAYSDVKFSENGYGFFSKKIDFTTLIYYNNNDEELEGGLPDGTYKMIITKPSHLSFEMDNLDFTGSSCSQLLGMKVTLPCGDIRPQAKKDTPYWLGNGHIKLDDRSILLSYLNGDERGDPALTETAAGDPNLAYYADLNGDGIVSLADLDILMLPENFNQKSIKLS